MGSSDTNDAYVERWFWRLDELAERVGAATDAVLDLIGARCAPGAIYVRREDGGWWSALDRTRITCPEGVSWYSPASAWGLRRALLSMRRGVSPAQAAAAERTQFVAEFVDLLQATEHAAIGFPSCFVAGAVDHLAAERQAAQEWESWIGGGYGVCLRVFTARACIAKEALRAALLRGFDEGEAGDDMLRYAEALSAWILPFAPWQRASGTPGRTIDRLLVELSLGSERPYD